jgi:hypothetical protein
MPKKMFWAEHPFAANSRRPSASKRREPRVRPGQRVFEQLEDRRLLTAATLLNEIDINPPGMQDHRYEYVELEGTPGASLNNVWFVAFDSGGVPEVALNLTGSSIGADGLAVIKNSTAGFSIPAATTLIPDNTFFTQTGGFAQTPISFYLFSSPNPFSASTDYDTNNDGVLDHLPTGATVMDNVANEKGTALVYGGVEIFDDNGGTPDAVTRFFGDTTNTTASWFGGELNDTGNVASTTQYDSTRPGTNMPLNPLPSLTPGGLNYPVPAGPTVTPSGNTASFTGGATPIVLDSGITLSDPESSTISSATITTTGFSEDTYGFSLPPTMSSTITQGQNGQGAVNVITLTGLDTVADYQAALRSITYQDTAGGNATQGQRTLSVTINDGITTASASEHVNVSIAAPSLTVGGTAAAYTAGGPAVAIDSGLTITPGGDANLSKATVTIANFQTGDTLNFTPQNNISILSYTGGVLTLTGSSSVANYQAALQSITFANSTSPSLAARSLSIVVQDGSLFSSPASESINVVAPAEVSGLYVKGSTWSSAFDSYLASNTLGNTATPSLGYALQTGTAQSATLPWTNVDTIEARFNQPVLGVGQNSLVLSGGTAGSTPLVTGFSSLGNNTYAWTLSGPLTNNRYEISFLSSGITDARGAALDGEWSSGTSTFSAGDGNGLAGGNFNFLFNVTPGDADQTSLVNANDYNKVRAKLGDVTSSTAYTPFVDLDGNGLINANDYNSIRARLGATLPISAPAPQVAQVDGLQTDDGTSLTGLALATQEGTTTSAGTISTGTVATGTGISNSVAASAAISTAGTSNNSAGDDGNDLAGGSGGTSGSLSTQLTSSSQNQATDAAFADFDLTDLWV